MSHRQHQAGCPPTVQRGSGSSPRWRQRSSVAGLASSRSPISASPTGSCLVCWSAMERRRLLPVGKALPWEPAPAAIGYPFGGTRISCWLSQPRSGPRPAGRGRRETARRRAGDQSGGPPSAKRSPGCTGKPGDRPARPLARRGYPNNFRANRPDPTDRGVTGMPTPRRSRPVLPRLSRTRPTVVMGDRPGGSSSRRCATQPSPSRVTVPRIFVAQVPDQCRGVSCRQVRRPLVGVGVGFLPGVLEAAAPVTTHLYEHTFVVVAWQERGMRRFPAGYGKGSDAGRRRALAGRAAPCRGQTRRCWGHRHG
jgi:hypothetical protein